VSGINQLKKRLRRVPALRKAVRAYRRVTGRRAAGTYASVPIARELLLTEDTPVRAENKRSGTLDWLPGSRSGDDRAHQIKAFASTTSVNLGGAIDFHVSLAEPQTYTIAIYRLGYYGGQRGRLVHTSPTLAGVTQPPAVTEPETGMISCAWSPSWTLSVPANWTSGLYLAQLTTASGVRTHVPFVVRDDARAADFLVLLPFATYQAYNQYPYDGERGKSLYYGYLPDTPEAPAKDNGGVFNEIAGGYLSVTTRARVVSFDRPYARDGVPQRFDIDQDFIAWAERMGYDLSYASDLDLELGHLDLSRYRALVFSGHDEYFSHPMRAACAGALADGANLAFMTANNIYWHVRFSPNPQGGPARQMACYKYEDDPDSPCGGTQQWRQLDDGAQAEQALLGVQYNGIVKGRWPLVVANSDHWMWSGTGVTDGTELPKIVAGEADGRMSGFPLPADIAQTLLSASPFELRSGKQQVQNTSLYQTRAGAWMFVAGTFNWPLGLARPHYADQRLIRATANLFARLREEPKPRLADAETAAQPAAAEPDAAGQHDSGQREAG
jgi:hypothetical protein